MNENVAENSANGKVSTLASASVKSLLHKRDTDDAVEQENANRADLVGNSFSFVANDIDAEADFAHKKSTSCEDVEDFTTTGDANRIADRHADRIAFCPELGWLSWNGRHWQSGDAAKGHAENMAAETSHALQLKLQPEMEKLEERIGKISKEDLATPDGKALVARYKHVKGGVKWAHDGKNQNRIEAAVKRASAHGELAKRQSDFDTHKMLLNVANGTLDLRTGELVDHDHTKLITQMIPVEYDLAAQCPVFDRFLETSVLDAEHRAFLMRFLGYCLTGIDKEHVMLLMLGEGRNGKGTLMETIRKLFGEYGVGAKGASFLSVKHEAGGGAASPDVVRWRGRRLISVSELKAGATLNESFVKSITGGDTITARALFKSEFEFSPQFKIIWSLNDKPVISGDDFAIWERLILMPWDRKFEDHEKDKDLKEKLELELPGILRKLVVGCQEWQRGGLQIPSSMKAAKESWRSEENVTLDFLEEHYEQAQYAHEEVEAKAFRAQMEAWCKKTDRPCPSKQNMGRSLRRVAWLKFRESNGKTIYGHIKRVRNDNDFGGGYHD